MLKSIQWCFTKILPLLSRLAYPERPEPLKFYPLGSKRLKAMSVPHFKCSGPAYESLSNVHPQ